MANDKKFVVKNGLTAKEIDFVDDIISPNNTITATMLTDGTLSFSGTSGQLFSITDDLSGTLFAVNDISGIPSIEVDADGTVRLAEFAGNILIGTATDNGLDKLQVNGSISANGFVGNATTATTLATARTISLGGDVTGSASFNGSANITITAAIADDSHNHIISNVDGLQTALDGKLATTANAVSATKLLTTRSIALGGDVTGSANFDGSANITITATIADDSHNHVIANVDGLQTALDGKAASSHTHTTAQVTGLDTALAGKASLAGATYTGDITAPNYVTNAVSDRVKFSVWNNNSTYGIGMGASYTYGHLNEYAMTFQMTNTANRGWWWGAQTHSNAQGSMSLTQEGKLHVDDSITVGTTTNNVFTLADVASQAEAEAGTDNTSPMTPLRTAQAIVELAGKPVVNNDTTTNATKYILWNTGTTGDISPSVSSSKLYFNPSTGVLNSTDYNTLSDMRLKENIQNITVNYGQLDLINGVSFDWKDNSVSSYGFIAQEVEAIFPEMVQTNEETGMKSVSYSQMVPHLLEVIKDLNRRLEALESK